MNHSDMFMMLLLFYVEVKVWLDTYFDKTIGVILVYLNYTFVYQRNRTAWRIMVELLIILYEYFQLIN